MIGAPAGSISTAFLIQYVAFMLVHAGAIIGTMAMICAARYASTALNDGRDRRDGQWSLIILDVPIIFAFSMGQA